MATRGTDIGEDWTEVTGPLALVDGASYAVEMHGPVSAVVYAHDTQAAGAPAAGADGHTWFTRSKRPEGELRVFPKRAGWFWWLRAERGACRAVVSEKG